MTADQAERCLTAHAPVLLRPEERQPRPLRAVRKRLSQADPEGGRDADPDPSPVPPRGWDSCEREGSGEPVGFVNSVVADFQGNPEPVPPAFRPQLASRRTAESDSSGARALASDFSGPLARARLPVAAEVLDRADAQLFEGEAVRRIAVCRSRPSGKRVERPPAASRRPPDPLITPPGVRHDSPANRARPNLRTLRGCRFMAKSSSTADGDACANTRNRCGER